MKFAVHDDTLDEMYDRLVKVQKLCSDDDPDSAYDSIEYIKLLIRMCQDRGNEDV